jgi:hypothetical protein
MQSDRLTEVTKLIVAFRNFAKAQKKSRRFHLIAWRAHYANFESVVDFILTRFLRLRRSNHFPRHITSRALKTCCSLLCLFCFL